MANAESGEPCHVQNSSTITKDVIARMADAIVQRSSAASFASWLVNYLKSVLCKCSWNMCVR